MFVDLCFSKTNEDAVPMLSSSKKNAKLGGAKEAEADRLCVANSGSARATLAAPVSEKQNKMLDA